MSSAGDPDSSVVSTGVSINSSSDSSGGTAGGSSTNYFSDYETVSRCIVTSNLDEEAKHDYLKNLFSELSGDSTVELTGKLTDADIETIAEGIKDCGHNINLDLSGITGLTSIPDAFSECTHLTGISLPATVTTIDYLSECGLEHITIPANSEDIGQCAFWELINLESLDVSDSNPNYSSQDGILYNKDKTKLIYFPNGKTGSYTIPETVETICEGALSFCENLTELNIPSSVTTIEEINFSLCATITAINVSDSNPNYSSQDGILYDKDKTTLICFPRGKTTSYTIPDSVKTIEPYAFANCDSITNIDFLSSIETIGNSAFSGCTGLTNIIIPNGVTEIGYKAFEGCTGLTQVTIPESVEKIGSLVFENCDSLVSVIFSGNNINWKTYQTDNNKKRGTPIDVSKPETNATNFMDKNIKRYYWYKS